MRKDPGPGPDDAPARLAKRQNFNQGPGFSSRIGGGAEGPGSGSRIDGDDGPIVARPGKMKSNLTLTF